MSEINEQLPISFVTDFIGDGWNKVGDIKNAIENIKQTFSSVGNLPDILQDLADAYLVCIGRLEKYLDNKDYIEKPTAEMAIEATGDATNDENPVGDIVSANPVLVPKMNIQAPKVAAQTIADAVADDLDGKNGEAFEFEADFDDIPVSTNPATDDDIEELRRLFSI